MNKTLKATVAIVISCVVMVVVVIYTPKPKKRETLKRETLEERHQRREKERLPYQLTLEALGMANKAITAISEAHELIHEEKADLKPLIEKNLKAIAALTEASEAVKSGTDEIQRLNEEQIDLNPLIEANTALIEALTKVIESMKTLTEELQRFTEELQRLTEEKAHPWPPHEPIYEALDNVSKTVAFALDVYEPASNALFQYLDTRREHYFPTAPDEKNK